MGSPSMDRVIKLTRGMLRERRTIRAIDTAARPARSKVEAKSVLPVRNAGEALATAACGPDAGVDSAVGMGAEDLATRGITNDD